MEEKVNYCFSYEFSSEYESELNKNWKQLIEELSNGAFVKVSYDEYEGQLIMAERKEFGPCIHGETRVVYGITLCNEDKHITYDISGLKIDNAKFSGTSIFEKL